MQACKIQSTLGLETATPLTDPRQYINSNLGFRNLKIWLLYSKIAAVVVSKPSGIKICLVISVHAPCTERPLTDTPAQQSLCFTYKSTCISYSPLSCSLHPSAEKRLASSVKLWPPETSKWRKKCARKFKSKRRNRRLVSSVKLWAFATTQLLKMSSLF